MVLPQNPRTDAGKEPPKSVPCAKPYKHFSSVELPGFNRDIVGELIGAARAGGIAPGLYFRSVLGSWVGVWRLLHLSLVLTAPRVALPKIIVLTASCALL